ncbi:MAG: hypothetical protein ACLR2E_02760 [Lachnospiraceae bacterium]
MTAYINKLKSMSTKELEETWDSLDEMNDYLQTSITKNQYLELIKTMRKMDFTEDNFVILQEPIRKENFMMSFMQTRKRFWI